MSIGTTIRQLRHEHDMTQEQLAGFLGLTPAAVSGWECDRNAPDISQIPQLCSIFGVSADVLLGIDLTNQEKRIDAVIDRAERCGHMEKIEIYRRGLAENPSSYELMLRLAQALDYYDEPETYEKRWKERVALLETVREGTQDAYLKNEAEGWLCMTYKEKGMRDEALRIAESVPNLSFSHRQLERLLAVGMDKIYGLHHDIKGDFLSLCDDIYMFALTQVDGKPFFGSEDAIRLLEKIPEFYRVYFEDGDYLRLNQDLSRVYIALAERYADLGDEENTLNALRHARDCAEAADAVWGGLAPGPYGVTDVWGYPIMPEKNCHTSLLARYSLDYPTTTLCITKEETEGCGNAEHVRSTAGQVRFDFIRGRVNEMFAET